MKRVAMETKVDVESYNFLLSNWYSGATVLSIILNNHKSITCNGETFPFQDQDPNKLICSCGQTVSNCEFYRYTCGQFLKNGIFDRKYFGIIPVISRYKAIQRLFYSYRYTYKVREVLLKILPGYVDTVDKFIELHSEFYRLACEFNGSKVYLDGTKSVRRAELFAGYGGKPVKIIHSIRDGRKFVASYMRICKLGEKDIPFIAKEWIDYLEMVNTLKIRYPNIQIKEVRHEDLCSDKFKAIQEVCAFLGVEYDNDVFNFSGDEYHMLGNDMRHKFDGVVRENEGWKKMYTKESLNRVTALLEPYLQKYNYI